MAIEVGKEVIVISAHHTNPFKKGEIYTVKGIVQKECCGNINIDIGTKSNCNKLECVCGYIGPNDNYYSASRFAPIDDIEISELTEILKKQIFEI